MIEGRELGRTDLRVSALGFGCGAIGGLMTKGDPAEQRRAVARAIEAGITYFDTAPSYGDGRSEENLGRVLDELGRPDVVVGTKFRVEPGEADVAGAVRRSTEVSLRRLRRDSVHLLQLHNRIEGDLDAVFDAMDALKAAGLCEHVGVTAMGETADVRRVVESGRIETAQVYFNAINPSAGWAGVHGRNDQDFDGLIDRAALHGVGVINIRPLAAGAVTGRPERHANAGDPGRLGMAGVAYDQDLPRGAALADLAGVLGLEGPVELALRFSLAKPGVSTVIVGYSDAGQLEDAIRFAERGPLPQDALNRVLALGR